MNVSAINTYKCNVIIENIAKNAIIEMQELTDEAHRLASQLSDEQVREMIAYYTKGV